MSPIRIAIVEDDEEALQALVYILNYAHGMQGVATARNGEDAVARFPDLKPDVILLDIQLPGMSGIDCLEIISALLPQTQFMMLTVVEDYGSIFRALRSGATGYLLKSSPPGKIIEAIQELHAGGSPISSQIARQVIAAFREMPLNRQGFPTAPLIGRPETWAGKEDIVHHPDLSPRESEVLHWLAKGYLYKEVGAQLAMSTATVRAHVQRIYRKLQVHSKTAAASKIRLG